MAQQTWTTADIGDQTGRVAIVTGANSGIAYETAKALAAKGATVIVASRNKQRGSKAVEDLRRELAGATVEFMLLDLASQASVRTFADAFKARFDRLDLLINNAGLMMPSTRQEDGGWL